jgi:hypothetical protein
METCFDLTFLFFINKICHPGRVQIAEGKYEMGNPLIGSLRAQSLAAIECGLFEDWPPQPDL